MDQSGQSGQGGRPGSDPAGSSGGSSSGWQSTPGSTGSGAEGGTSSGGTAGGGAAGGGGTSGGWQSGSTPTGSSSPPTWQSTPEQTPAQTGASWERPATSGAGAPAVPGTAGYFYADVPNRAIAYIIDAVILAIIGIVVGIILTPLVGSNVSFSDPNQPFNATVNTGALLISTIVSTIVNGLYFVGSWITWRATPGQRILGMQVGNETDGATLTTNQAITRWILLGAPFGIASALAGVSGLGVLIGIAALVWLIVLLVTTAQSPTKQGLHDRYAHTVVVKAGRSVS